MTTLLQIYCWVCWWYIRIGKHCCGWVPQPISRYPRFSFSSFVCVCLATCVYACIAACLWVCAALLVAWRAAPTILHLCGYFAPSLSAQVRKTMNDCYCAGWHAQFVKLTGNTVETRAFSASYTSVVTVNGRPYVWWVETFERAVWPDTGSCVHC